MATPERTIRCPSCQAVLSVTHAPTSRPVQCGKCQHVFQLPRRLDVTDDAITSWLSDEQEGRDQAAFEVYEHVAKQAAAAAPDRPPPPQASPATAVLPMREVSKDIRLVKCDRQGAIIEFPASRLLSPAFRGAMPRRCLKCGSRAHLWAHLIIYAPKMQDSISLEAEHSAGKLVLSGDAARDLDMEDLLHRLPKVPNVPHPADLPMPYWVCDMCSGAGVVSGQIGVHPETGQGFCRVLIRSLRRAAEFIAAAGGASTPDFHELQRAIAAVVESPWDVLPEFVQHRLEQWYRPKQGERFLAYVPDRHLARIDDGMAGIAISDVRLVYHTQLRHKEVLVGEPLEVELTTSGARADLSLKTAQWDIRHTPLDRDGADALRRGLTAGKFSATWR